MAEETEKIVPRYHSSYPREGITQRDTNISLFCNGSTRLHLLWGFGTAALQPVHRFCRFVSRTNRHFSERASAPTTLRPCVCCTHYGTQGWLCQAKPLKFFANLLPTPKTQKQEAQPIENGWYVFPFCGYPNTLGVQETRCLNLIKQLRTSFHVFQHSRTSSDISRRSRKGMWYQQNNGL